MLFASPDDPGNLIMAIFTEYDAYGHTIRFTLPYGTDVTRLIPIFYLSEGATVNYTSQDSLDFSSEQHFTVTSEDGATVNDWTVSCITSAPDNTAVLGTLAIDQGTLTPEFNPDTAEYSVTVPYSVENIKITVSGPATANVTINGQSVGYSAEAGPFDLAVGENTFTIEVTAQDGVTKKVYTLTVTRQSENAGSGENNPGDSSSTGYGTDNSGSTGGSTNPDNSGTTLGDTSGNTSGGTSGGSGGSGGNVIKQDNQENKQRSHRTA